jgi:hypothetical protein
MRAQLRSELVKVRSTRTSLGLLGAMIGSSYCSWFCTA